MVNISRFTESISGSCMEGRGSLQGTIVALWPDHRLLVHEDPGSASLPYLDAPRPGTALGAGEAAGAANSAGNGRLAS